MRGRHESYLAKGGRMKRLFAGFVLALVAGAVMSVPAWAGAGGDRRIEVNYSIEYVLLEGYPEADMPVLIEVYRNATATPNSGVRIGSFEGTTEPDSQGRAGNVLEVNHVGGGQFEDGGDCWREPSTPNIHPGDKVQATLLTAPGGERTNQVDYTFVRDLTFTDDGGAVSGRALGVEEGGGFDVTAPITGLAAGGAEFIEARREPNGVREFVFPDANGNFNNVPLEGTGGEVTLQYVNPNADGEGDESTVAEPTNAAGEGEELAGCPPLADYEILTSNPEVVNGPFVNGNDPLLLSGVSFDAEGVSVTIDDNDGVTTDAIQATADVAPASGPQSWTASFANAGFDGLADGNLTATATYTIPDPNNPTQTVEITSTKTILKDTQPPPVPSVPDLAASSDNGSSNSDNITNDNTPTFTGTAEAGSTVKIFVNGVEKGSGVATGGNYSITTSALDDGSHPVTATATDENGNTSAASGALSVTIDTIAPTPRPTADLAPGSDTGVSDTDNLTRDTTPTITGTTEGGVNVEIRVDGDAKGDAPSANDGSYSITTSELGSGNRVIRAVATDTAGNSSTSDALNVEIDTVAPNVTADRATGSHDAPIEVGLRSNDNQAAILYTLGSGAPNIEFTAPIRVADRSTIRAMARDRAGNESPIASFAYVIRKPTSVTLNMTTTPLALGGVKRFSGVVRPAHNTSVRMVVRKNGVVVLSRNLPLNDSRYASSYRPNRGVGRYSITIVFPKDADSLQSSVTKSFRVTR